MTPFYFLLFVCVALVLALVLFPLKGNVAIEATQKRRFIAIVSISMLLGALGLYSLFGSPQVIPLAAQHEQKMAQLRASIAEHAQKVKQNPKDVGAWVLLGQDFMDGGQYTAAASAFKQTVLLTGGDSRLILAYAKAQVMAAEGKVTDEAKRSLDMVLLQDKKNADARYFLAVYDLQNGKTQEAMAAMKALYHSLPKNSPLKNMINMQIGRAASD